MPIEQEINVRQLNFLHHILTLNENDPVRITYQEQLKYPQEKNWGNEVAELRIKYGITETDPEITNYSKESWKNYVKIVISKKVLEELNQEMAEQKHGGQMTPYEHLKQQKYLDTLNTQQTRKLFHIRAGVIDLKTVRKYWYSDRECRLCGQLEETVEHVVNDCGMLPRASQVGNVLSNELNEMATIADRCIQFAAKVKELEGEE